MPFTTAVEIAMVNVPAVTFPSLEARLSTREERSGSFVVEVDELLLARARRGEQAAVERLYRTFERPVYNLARRLCRTQHDAEDVLQETFLEVFRSLSRFRGEGSFAGWVRKVAASKALQKLRTQRTAPAETVLDDELVECLHSPEGGHSSAVVRMDLEAALANLSDTARAVVWLHEVEGWNHDEIALLWGKTASFSKSQLARAYARLRSWLGTQGRSS
ncbi:MAG: sigma-70 family RNA polymerase sigma factor [Thermoanaerobaculaceae bacterium]|nr:sigma-70 family RNA polymerase sigma factor [Thermoanaerobaculaceae bacterium]MDI9623122.1 sigma-70 family RNA polymerase sigma factor [Acidobacteriota bacterium]NLH10841.1 sigma-70 family RNA polymerase sigma factor [Holophagae bacterium]